MTHIEIIISVCPASHVFQSTKCWTVFGEIWYAL